MGFVRLRDLVQNMDDLRGLCGEKTPHRNDHVVAFKSILFIFGTRSLNSRISYSEILNGRGGNHR
jgi:hypothetical protein